MGPGISRRPRAPCTASDLPPAAGAEAQLRHRHGQASRFPLFCPEKPGTLPVPEGPLELERWTDGGQAGKSSQRLSLCSLTPPHPGLLPWPGACASTTANSRKVFPVASGQEILTEQAALNRKPGNGVHGEERKARMPDSAQQPSPGSCELGGSWASWLGRGLAWGPPWLPALHPCWGPSPEFYPHCKIRAPYECPKWGERLRRALPPDATGRGGVTCHPVEGRMTLLRGNPCPIQGPWECFLTQQRGTNGANQLDFQQGAAPGPPGRGGPNCGKGAGGQSQSDRAGLSLTSHRQPGRWREGPRAKKLGSRCSQSLQEGPALRHLGFRPMRPGPDSDLWTVGGDVLCGRSVWGGLGSHRPRPRPQSGQHPPGAVRGHASLQGLGQTLGPPGTGGHTLAV